MSLPLVPVDALDERRHRLLLATSVNELIKGRYSKPIIDAVEYFGLNGDGSTDNTARFQEMFSEGRSLYVRAGDYVTGLFTIPSGTVLYLAPGVVIRDSGALGANDRFMNITNDNVVIYGQGAKLLMDRADYPTGEQRHGVYIYGPRNVLIDGLESSNSGGDGFYIGGSAGDPATNVVLRNCKGDNNRRQGLSVVNARNFRDIDGEYTNTNGTAPSAGVDIEPNSTTDVLEDIKLIRTRCTGNDGPGIEVFLAAWNSTSNYADIEIIEPYTANNGHASISGRVRPGIDINRVGSTTPCRGRIKVVDATCVDEQIAGIHVYDWDVNGPRVELIRPTVINPNQAQGSTSATHGGIILHNSTTHTTTPGNVRIEDPMVRDDDGYLNANSLTPYRVSGIWDLVEVINPRYAYAGSNPWSISDTAAEVRFRTDTPIVAAQGSSQSFTDGRYLGRTVTNASAGALITYTLNAASTDRIGWRYRFEVTGSGGIAIDPNGTQAIRGGTAGQYLTSTTIGDNVTIECDSATTWKVVERYGTWAFV